jgi:lipoprotein-anchoring transpeptidase ErfK/SrfK
MRRIQRSETRRKAKWGPDARLVCLAGMVLLGAAELTAQVRPATPTPESAQAGPAERRIVISIPDRKLALIEDGVEVKVYPVAVGRRVTPSPTGTYHIANRVKNPTYYRPGVVIPPGKSNPVGTRWIGLSIRGYGIHGTDEPRSIGHAASHGCIRMRRHDIEDLFARVRVGDVVEFHHHADAETLALFHDGRTRKPVLTAAAYVTGGAH